MTDFDAIAVGRRVLTAEADALKLQADTLGEAFVRAVDILFAAKGRIICTGIGKSGHVAKKIAATFASGESPARTLMMNTAQPLPAGGRCDSINQHQLQ